MSVGDQKRQKTNMLHIDIIAVGKLKERFWREACDEYLKRMKPYAYVRVVEIADVDPSGAGGAKDALRREGAAILDALPEKCTVVLLDIQGKLVSSEDMAERIEALTVDGVSNIAFIIGGSHGVDGEVAARADMRWSLGRITMPHNLARVVIIEQIYRAFKIIRREPYHK